MRERHPPRVARSEVLLALEQYKDCELNLAELNQRIKKQNEGIGKLIKLRQKIFKKIDMGIAWGKICNLTYCVVCLMRRYMAFC